MNIQIGIDVGAVGVKAAVLAGDASAVRLVESNGHGQMLQALAVPTRDGTRVYTVEARRTRGRPLETVRELLSELLRHLGVERVSGIVLTGSGGKLAGEALGTRVCNEFQATARAVDFLYPHIRTVFEIGGEASKYLRLEPDGGSGTLGIVDYSTNGDCAAGTGAFLDQQAGRLQCAVEDIAAMVAQAERTAQIAGRCSVFAKSDMIHAQQKGFTPPEVLRGLCHAVAVNFRSAVVKGRTIQAPIALIGGVSANFAVVQSLAEVFDLEDGELLVPEGAAALGAIGAALVAAEADGRNAAGEVQPLRLNLAADAGGYSFATTAPLSLERVRLLRDQARPRELPESGPMVDAWMGLDIGSVGTKLVVIDTQGEVIHSIFTRTDGRPIEVVTRCLREIGAAVGLRVNIQAVGATGSGRELIGELVGADSINDEITAHKTGAAFVGDRLLGRRPDTIFEIGGQDSKYISLQPEGGGGRESIVVDFTMNEACAAGTGSFLEERAEELGVAIKDEFARLALSSRAPIRLGERCTVFMERDVNTCMQRGARLEDVIAGLAYSIAYNYINRVVRGRPIGQTIFFQGGTAYNDAVAAAFAAVTGREIIVPPHNALLGAIGAAMLAGEKMHSAGTASRFRGYDVTNTDYTLREFTCKGCGNHCSVQEFTVEGEKTYWGDKCSDRYRKRAKTERKPVIPDLVALRRKLLVADDTGDSPQATRSVGIPLAMYSYDLLPLWRRFWRECGFKVVVSEETNRRTVRMGFDTAVAEPCFPIIVAHGHVAALAEKGVDYIWVPNIVSAESNCTDNESHVCPWGQTLPFVVRQSPALKYWPGRILCPTLRMDEGHEHVRSVLVATARELGVSKDVAARAFAAALAAEQAFRAAYQQAGLEALQVLERTGEPGMVLVGRPYNIHDAGVSLAVARKVGEHYGVNVLPIDALPVSDVDVTDVNDNMFWEYGRKILAAAKLVGAHPNLHIIYITNFKCGPDSFIKGYILPASGKPFLTLQFDGHSNDAGMMTRCEAYLDSKGILRWWRKPASPEPTAASPDERCTSPRWPTPVPG